VIGLEALWALALASRRGFRQGAQDHVSTPGIPGNLEGAGVFDSAGEHGPTRITHLSIMSELLNYSPTIPLAELERVSHLHAVSTTASSAL
jgi:hypothetical protein